MQNDTTRVTVPAPRKAPTTAPKTGLGQGATDPPVPFADEDTVVDPPCVALVARMQRGSFSVTEVRHWVTQGADIDLTDAHGTSALMLAAAAGSRPLVAYLVAQGAQVNLMDDRGYTAFGLAAHYGHWQILAYLKSRGANPNAVAPLFNAVRYGHETAVRLLIRYGANVALRDRFGRTLLMVSAASGHWHVLYFLLCLGIDPQARSHSGHTAFELAVMGGHFRLAALLENGDDGFRRFSPRHLRYRLAQSRLRKTPRL